MTHLCHAVGCGAPVPPRLLFCRRHWRLVSPDLQQLIWATYVPGQEVRKDPSPVYLVAQAHVVSQVARTEGLWTAEQAVAHTMKEIEEHVLAGALSLEDVALLAQHDPVSFMPALKVIRAQRAAGSKLS